MKHMKFANGRFAFTSNNIKAVDVQLISARVKNWKTYDAPDDEGWLEIVLEAEDGQAEVCEYTCFCKTTTLLCTETYGSTAFGIKHLRDVAE